jgi:hypothetical protein
MRETGHISSPCESRRLGAGGDIDDDAEGVTGEDLLLRPWQGTGFYSLVAFVRLIRSEKCYLCVLNNVATIGAHETTGC